MPSDSSASLTARYAEVCAYLFGLKATHGLKFGIDRMRSFAAALGNPEAALPLVHVAGTNGKGSVVAMLDSIFRAAGWRVGMYTSPHLVMLGERVQVQRHALRPEEIVAYVDELRPLAERVGGGNAEDCPSFFEFMTAMALLQFGRQRCDIGLVEVGLGGRLDATNIVTPELSIISSIGMDHCEMLGHSLEEIAAEKAGVIKPQVPVVIGRLPAAAEAVVRALAAELAAPVHSVREVFGEGDGRGDWAAYPQTNLEGDYQRWNAATATLAARVLMAQNPRWALTPSCISEGLAQVAWPGRWQRVQVGGRLLILDSSHNPEGAGVLDANLARLVAETGRRPVVIAGVLGAARARPLLETISRHASALHLVVPDQARACSLDELMGLVPPDFRGKVVPDTVAQLFPAAGQCTAGRAEDVLVVTGSIYLIGEVLARLTPPERAPEPRLQDF
ncbi:bifunctional folylpolyglutamate synthase/dihydrofolate synthase [Cephaloticoccus capnophilus]|uniref:tetrahydrofolate synthase n=1 Tax=Cephaloticoccus capnophilus TaxID=1548208 RepID=A0A139STQ1_9BACT|nr:folylpolyglutamate synthase/dihydrofolate synthase family protein [Cephaloticoccus capnophilus]KXU37840.1 bifunctional folylpolyglutamate synthase/dihydrofolate synthase [Cephaloticoccus capnophilus]